MNTMKKCFLVAFLICFVNTSFAVNNYISDDLSVSYRTGPSEKYRISGAITSGDKITIIDSTNSRFFYKIKTEQGKSGWVPRELVKSGSSAKEKVKELQQTVSTSIALIKKQADEIHRLKSLINTQKVKNDYHSNKQSQLTTEISSLNNQINKLDDSNLIRWVTHIGIVLVFAIFLLSIVSLIRKRKSYNQIY